MARIKSHILSKFIVLCWIVFLAIIGTCHYSGATNWLQLQTLKQLCWLVDWLNNLLALSFTPFQVFFFHLVLIDFHFFRIVFYDMNLSITVSLKIFGNSCFAWVESQTWYGAHFVPDVIDLERISSYSEDRWGQNLQ